MTADPAVRGKRERHRPVRLLSCLYVAVFMQTSAISLPYIHLSTQILPWIKDMPHILAAYKQYYKAENTPRLTSEHPEHTPVLQNGPSVGDLDSQKSFRGSTSTEDLCAGHLRSARPCFGAHAPKCDIFCYGPWIIQKQKCIEHTAHGNLLF